MSNVSEYKRIKSRWVSPAFHTAKCGYKLKLVVDADGADSGNGTHVSTGVFVMKGENDDNLDWPVNFDVTVQLLNLREDKRRVERIASFNDCTMLDCRQRMLEDIMSPYGMFHYQFISHTDLEYNSDKGTEYLRNDSLCFHVSKVTLLKGKYH